MSDRPKTTLLELGKEMLNRAKERRERAKEFPQDKAFFEAQAITWESAAQLVKRESRKTREPK